MTVYLVGAGPGDPGLLTRRGAELLGRAEVVVYDRLVDPALLALAPRHALLFDAGKLPAPGGAARQADIDALLVEHGRAGRTVVRLKGGDPFLFGRGGEEAEALDAAGVAWEVVPGVTSATAVPAYAGIPVTHRGLSTSVTIVTGRVGQDSGEGVNWKALAQTGGTLVILMGAATRAEIARQLMAAGRPADTPAAVVQWGTTPAQRIARTTLGQLELVDLGPPSAVVVGPVAALDLDWRSRLPLAGTTVVVTRATHQAGPLTDALADLGARVLLVPVLEIADPPDGGVALRRAGEEAGAYAWVAFTSANAVHRLVPLLRDSRGFGQARLAAVGPATTAALAEYHLVADLQGDGQAGAAGLVAAMGDPPDGGRVLFPAAAGARRTLAEGLRQGGWEVDEVVAYRTVAAPPPPAAVLEQVAHAQVVTFASPSAVEAYLALRTEAGPVPVPPVVACIGPVTAEAAREKGLAVAVEAAAASAADVASAVAAHLAGGPGPSS